ncbi:sensor domain-containing diguanylate cyclase [Radiobacillus kanasensis]|uniref:sensor domain-containing diguanylate cyclase n=1 Tax=Radiobacillus kanasensis TaxID=2844358 RepID=UPI001E4C1201|nr:sensor domain-containing diguanylate cyclase [Radiobacillus kanasensis]UFT97933.1 sensor domain-containing diguanylate cyclase [Radiobacillus kanasensis]
MSRRGVVDMVPKSKQVALWLAWLLIWPWAIWMIYQAWTPVNLQGQWIAILSFGLLMSVVAAFPLIVNNIPIFFVHGISFAVFLSFGLFVEIILTQIALVVLMLKLRVGTKELFRYPLNMLMFLSVSVTAAYTFELLGGDVNSVSTQSLNSLLPVIGYVIATFLTNQILLKFFQKIVYGVNLKWFDKGIAWEFMTSLIVLPVGFVLYLMYGEIGVAAVYYVGVPFISISVILMLYYSTQSVNYYLQKTSEIGHKLTEQLEMNEVIDLFIEEITSLLPIDYVLIYDVTDQTYLKLTRFYDIEKKMDFPEKDRLFKFESVSGHVWGSQRGVHFHSNKEWNKMKDVALPISTESLISLPIERNNQITGVLTILSKKRRAFEKYQFMLVDILINYLAVAMGNARSYEETKTKSERDSLTQLYNYRYLESYLQAMTDCPKPVKPISLILLDLDHFKQVNDTYGHQSGNEILQELAKRLTKVVGSANLVARYGGEEFVVLLENTPLEEGREVAERIRTVIADIPFVVAQHILVQEEAVSVNITASIGMATYPNNCEDPIELIRHADRAMYVGAKQAGRNRVAVYEQVTTEPI